MRKISLFLAGLFMVTAISANDKTDSLQLAKEAWQKMIDSVEGSLHYKTGKIALSGGAISLNVPPGFKFLESAEAKYVIEDVWGNPPGDAPLGLLLPADGNVIGDFYAFVVSFEDIGYVKDDDASKVDYDELLGTMKKDNLESNAERARLNLSKMTLVGWAAKPYYDKDKKILHWAKEFQVEDEDENTLNYDVRVLGRKGVLNLRAVATMTQLDSVNAHINDVITMAAFTDGNRYSDFDSSTDNVAAWTIGGLVAGKMLAKVGFFAIILKYLKLIIAGVVLAGGAIWRFITGRRKNREQDLSYVPTPAPVPVEDRADTAPPAQ
ncbi:DUF2167 domain-containing protein [Terrimonas sp. NA20]|uniref:DUF2167 domain-containing protein n=1 Tax=Terrimonas ginsenosidimutans TaxID=2908004 RepID=A0ABS9KKU2_9BACT|nr:DUF2167 domain-containing protein [Terrimonas ginsenosidimutans]MCG2612939.1 DUF2167 domain-containing protein [Terrimonas ginsenosidimutans]